MYTLDYGNILGRGGVRWHCQVGTSSASVIHPFFAEYDELHVQLVKSVDHSSFSLLRGFYWSQLGETHGKEFESTLEVRPFAPHPNEYSR